MQIAIPLPGEAASPRSERIRDRLAETCPSDRIIGPDPVDPQATPGGDLYRDLEQRLVHHRPSQWLVQLATQKRLPDETARRRSAARKARDSASGERPASELGLLKVFGPVQNLSARRCAMLSCYPHERGPP